MAGETDSAKRNKKILWLVVFAFFIALVLPRLICRDMFLDGMTYAAIARNQAENRGGFWSPHYSETVYPFFYEHPPLGIWLQSLAFRIFGDSADVEFFWGAGCGLLILLLMSAIWKTIHAGRFPAPGGWWPAAIFLLMPLSSWTLANNLLENTMTCFILLGVWAAWRAFQRGTLLTESAWAAFSGMMLAMAMLTKGVPAAFIVATPITFALIRKRPLAAAARVSAIMIAVAVASLWIVYARGGEAAAHLVKHYLSEQLLNSLKGQREIAGSHFFLLKKWLAEFSLPFLLSAILTFFGRRHGPERNSRRMADRSNAALFLAMALAASLPLLISPKQAGWYLFPSLPFWALGIAAAFPWPALKIEALFAGRPRWPKKAALAAVMAIIVIAGGTMLFKGKMVLRNRPLFADIDYRSAALPRGQTMTVYPPTLVSDWYVVAYMQRFLRASLTPAVGSRYCLVDGSAGQAVPPGYHPLSAGKPQKYFLCMNDRPIENPSTK